MTHQIIIDKAEQEYLAQAPRIAAILQTYQNDVYLKKVEKELRQAFLAGVSAGTEAATWLVKDSLKIDVSRRNKATEGAMKP